MFVAKTGNDITASLSHEPAMILGHHCGIWLKAPVILSLPVHGLIRQ